MSPTRKASAVTALQRAVSSRPPAPPRADRVKPVRITVDLSPAEYEALNHWIAEAGTQVNSAPGQRVTLSKAMRAMIHATTVDKSIGLVVIDLLRQGSEQR